MKRTKKKVAAMFQIFHAQLLMSNIINNTLHIIKWRQRRRARINQLERLALQIKSQMAEIILKTRKPRTASKWGGVDWFKELVWTDDFTESDWLENFRLTKPTFVYICNELRERLGVKPNPLNNFRQQAKVVTVEKKVAMSLFFLASCCEYRVVAEQFGVHKSTVCKALHEFVRATNLILTPKFIQMPAEAEAFETARLFEASSRIPNVIGAIDCLHIPILPPNNGYKDYVNCNGWPAMVLQGVVDHEYKFIDVSIKSTGSTNVAAVLSSSNLYKDIKNVLPKGTVNLNGRELPFVIIGDPAYPLHPWLMKDYSATELTPSEASFNAYLNSARVPINIAFRRLKARWRCILKRLDVHYSFVPQVVAICCTLHNIAETFKDKFDDSWLKAVEAAELIFKQPMKDRRGYDDEFQGYDIRKFLTDYLT